MGRLKWVTSTSYGNEKVNRASDDCGLARWKVIERDYELLLVICDKRIHISQIVLQIHVIKLLFARCTEIDQKNCVFGCRYSRSRHLPIFKKTACYVEERLVTEK